MAENIGMMGGAFFVPRGEILSWVNTLLSVNLEYIEQLGTGSVYCQILDAIYPGKIPISKVNWKAKLEYEFINNFKILQQSFLKLNIKKYIEVEKLSKAKYQDNLEFVQWMKRFYDLNHTKAEPYDAKERRNNAETDFSFISYRQPRHVHYFSEHKERSDSQNIEKKFKSPIRKRDFSNARIEHSMITSKDYEKDIAYLKLKRIEEILKEHDDDEKRVLGKIKDVVKSDGKELLISHRENVEDMAKNVINS